MKSEYIFVAWGIGITPFRSMIQSLLDTNKKERVTLFYTVTNPKDIIFKDVFSNAEAQLGIKTFYFADKDFSAEVFKQKGIDPLHVTFYLSGPQPIVEQFRENLFQLGVENNRIKTDLFIGYEQSE